MSVPTGRRGDSWHGTEGTDRKKHWAVKQQNVMSMCRKDDKRNEPNTKLGGAAADGL